MKKIMEQWGDFSFEEPKKVPFLTLPNSIMEHICRLLPTTHDKYIACLIHPQWSFAAQNVLWEKPRFHLPGEFRSFHKTISESKKKALLVRDVSLVFVDREPTLFSPIVKSTMYRHLISPLQELRFISVITSICENTTSLTIYGFRLETIHMERIASSVQALTSLHIIGAKVGHELVLNSLFSRLTTLRLDGNFNISMRWADALITRGIHLTELQISLQDMALDILARICTPQRLTQLTSLTLTDAKYLLDNHVVKVLEAFPQLTKLCIEGTTQLTPLSILISLNTCTNLNCLEIRANQESLQHEMDGSKLDYFYNNVRTGALPSRLLIENLNLDNDLLAALSPYFSYIQTLGFKGCPLLTADGIKLALCESRYLRLFQVINCTNIGSSILTAFADLTHISKYIYRIHMESSGFVDPKDIYQLCSTSVDFNIREIKFVHYDELKKTVIGSFNQDLMNGEYEEDESTICLDRRSIDAIAHSQDPGLCPIPEGRFISGDVLNRLSTHFKINVHDFIHLIDDLDKEISEEAASLRSSKPKNRKSFNRLSQLQSEQQNRSTTPALWSRDFSLNNISIYQHQQPSNDNLNVTDEYHTSDTQEITEEDDDDETGEDDEEEEEEEEDRYTNNDNDLRIAGSEISLGGWGVSLPDQWNAKQQQQQQQQTQQQQQQAQQQPQYIHTSLTHTSKPPKPVKWTGYLEEDYKEQWQQNSFEPSKPKNSFNHTNNKHYRNSPIVAESDGWGAAEKYVPWHDVQEQGFVKEVIEEQRNTLYWNGETYTNTADSVKPTTTSQTSGKSTPTLASSPPILFSSLANNLHQSQPPPRHSHSELRTRRDSLVSMDGSVSWNDNTKTVIKLNPAEPSPVSTNTPTPRFSVSRKSKWATVEEWNSFKEPTASTTTTSANNTPKQNHWFNTNEVNGATVTAAAAPPPRRPTFSRPRTDSAPRKTHTSNHHTETTANKWSNFIENSSSSSSHTTHNTSPVETKSQTAPTTPQTASINSVILIDTDNSPGISTRPVLKGDVWESLSMLDIPPSSAAATATANSDTLLLPQEATTTSSKKETPIETINWNAMDESKTNKQEDSAVDFFRFTDLVSGTVTDAEREMNSQEQMKDTVVDLGDLVSLTTPEYSPRVAASLVQVNDVEDNTSVNNTNTLKSMESLISPSTDTNTDQTVESPVQKSDPESPVPVPKSNPESPAPEPKPTTTTTELTESKSNTELDGLNNSSSETEKKTMKPIRLRVKLADDSFSELIVNDGDDIQSVVSKFCKENGLESSEPELYKKAVEKKTKMILKRRKKSKKSTN